MSIRVAILEDTPRLADSYAEDCEKAGYTWVGSVAQGHQIIRLVEDNHPDVVLIDLMLDGDRDRGIAALLLLRAMQPVPRTILVTAVPTETHLVLALKAGVDALYSKSTYHTRGWDLVDLIRKVILRASGEPPIIDPYFRKLYGPALDAQYGRDVDPTHDVPHGRLQFANLEIDLGARRVWRDGVPVPDLTTAEFNVLQLLVQGRGNVVPNHLLVRATGTASDLTSVVTLHPCVSRLRKKLNDNDKDLIRTARGVGYSIYSA